MEIEILSLDRIDRAQQAWRLSRDIQDYPSRNTVAPVDAPVNEMPSAILHFKDFMILEREIFVVPRNHVVWARTSRVDDPREFRTPRAFSHPQHAEIRNSMKSKANQGIGQDFWREELPLVSLTNWTSRISLRDLVKFELYFCYLAGKLPLFHDRFNRIANEIGRIIEDMVGTLELATQVKRSYKLAKFMFEGDRVFEGTETFRSSQFTLIRATVPLRLRAQLVRHRPLQFVDNFYSRVLSSERPELLNLDCSIDMELSAPNEIWHSVISKRSCWIAQHDLWAGIIQQFDGSLLPCADGTCPYSKDAELRFTAADPGAPCPRYANLNHIDKAPWINAMKKEVAGRGQFWEREIES